MKKPTQTPHPLTYSAEVLIRDLSETLAETIMSRRCWAEFGMGTRFSIRFSVPVLPGKYLNPWAGIGWDAS